jgi:hypothetical protein
MIYLLFIFVYAEFSLKAPSALAEHFYFFQSSFNMKLCQKKIYSYIKFFSLIKLIVMSQNK